MLTENYQKKEENPQAVIAQKLNFKGSEIEYTSNDDDDQSPFVFDNKSFQQQNFFSLFKAEFKQELNPNQEISSEDYIKLRDLNRKTLCLYLDQIKSNEEALKDIQKDFNGPSDDDCVDFERIKEDQSEESSQIPNRFSMKKDDENIDMVSDVSSLNNKKPYKKFPVKQRESFLHEYKLISDEEIDKNFKVILKNEINGKYLNTEIVANLEYFMNTLNICHKAKTENPFDNPGNYPALLFKGKSVIDIISQSEIITQSDDSYIQNDIYKIEVHQEDINNDEEMINNSSSNKFKESQNLTESFRNLSIYNQNMTPDVKQMERGKLEQTSDQSVEIQKEIKRQSINYINNLTILEKTQLLLKPQQNLKKVRDLVRNDRKSILSNLSSQGLTPKNNSQRQETLIDQTQVQEQILHQSINMIQSQSGQKIISSKFNIENPIKSKLKSPAPKNLKNGRFQKQNQTILSNFENLNQDFKNQQGYNRDKKNTCIDINTRIQDQIVFESISDQAMLDEEMHDESIIQKNLLKIENQGEQDNLDTCSI